MIPPDAAAVVVTAHPPSSEHPAYLEYSTAAADVAPVHSSGDQVCAALAGDRDGPGLFAASCRNSVLPFPVSIRTV